MTRKKKIRRIFFLMISVYIILNIFIFGFMTAYMNTNNIVSQDKLVMASITENDNETNISILGKNFKLKKNKTAENAARTAAYIFMPCKFRACTEIIINLHKLL